MGWLPRDVSRNRVVTKKLQPPQDVAALAQRVGTPAHMPPQQSPAELQFWPSTRQEAVQTGMPFEPVVQVPRQQSPSTSQGVPVSRHGPAPRSQRFVDPLQAPEQHALELPPVQPSPDARQTVLESSVHTWLSHEREQHSPSSAQAAFATLQIAPPHDPPLQASEQQSVATSQDEPSGRQ